MAQTSNEKKIYISPLNIEVEKQAQFLRLLLASELQHLPKVSVNTADDEVRAVEAAEEEGGVVVGFGGDSIIPLENLIAKLQGKGELYVEVTTAQEARTALEALELGATGVILKTGDPTEVAQARELLTQTYRVELEVGTVRRIQQLGMGDRVCVDTVEVMKEGTGMLVGSSSQGMLLIQAEVAENDFVASRPFRVNAGAVALYTLVGLHKTRYLQELEAGAETLVVTREGVGHLTFVARAKVEKRPLVLVEAVVEQAGRFLIAKALLQLAETVRLVQPSGSVAVTDLQVGDQVLAKFEAGGRHFGIHVDESVVEK